ncbi:hypothetical protein HA43_07445 [Pantoea eucrina]|nr:hypothetical protein HA43_07445 [Pantoea eucrina]
MTIKYDLQLHLSDINNNSKGTKQKERKTLEDRVGCFKKDRKPKLNKNTSTMPIKNAAFTEKFSVGSLNEQ